MCICRIKKVALCGQYMRLFSVATCASQCKLCRLRANARLSALLYREGGEGRKGREEREEGRERERRERERGER